jgi:hypothetical protein
LIVWVSQVVAETRAVSAHFINTFRPRSLKKTTSLSETSGQSCRLKTALAACGFVFRKHVADVLYPMTSESMINLLSRHIRRVLLAGLLPIASAAAQAQSAVIQYLHKMGLDDSQIASAATGQPVVKLIPAKSDRDVVVFGVIGVPISAADYMKHALDPGRLIGEGSSRFHIIADPATPADVREVGFDSSEFRDLKTCQPGNCNFKLPASAMKSFREGVNWDAPDAKAQADVRLQADALRLISGYRSRGNSALLTYDDNGGVRASDSFSALLAQSTELYDYAAPLQQYLTSYPANRPASTRDILYWSNGHPPHLRPTLTLDQVVVYPSSSGTTLIARKQVYASHYFDGAFELLAVASAASDAGAAPIYLVTVRRIRFDNLPGGVMNVRGRVRDGLVDETRSRLQRDRSAAMRK